MFYQIRQNYRSGSIFSRLTLRPSSTPRKPCLATAAARATEPRPRPQALPTQAVNEGCRLSLRLWWGDMKSYPPEKRTGERTTLQLGVNKQQPWPGKPLPNQTQKQTLTYGRQGKMAGWFPFASFDHLQESSDPRNPLSADHNKHWGRMWPRPLHATSRTARKPKPCRKKTRGCGRVTPCLCSLAPRRPRRCSPALSP